MKRLSKNEGLPDSLQIIILLWLAHHAGREGRPLKSDHPDND